MNQEKKDRFQIIEGIRGFCSLWVIACHTTDIFLFLIYICYYNRVAANIITDETILILLRASWPKITVALGYQVDIFFLISSFLFVHQCLQRRAKLANKEVPPQSKSLMKEIWQIYLKRMYRLWPLLICTILWTIWVQDYNSNNPLILLSLFLFPMDPNIPITFSVCWSVGVDFINTVIVYLLYSWLDWGGFFSYLDRCRTTSVRTMHITIGLLGVVLFLVSVLPRFALFATSSVSYLQVITSTDLRTHFVPSLMTPDRFQYYYQQLFPLLFSPTKELEFPGFNDNYQQLIISEYIMFFHRITPFFVGFILALLYFYHQNTQFNQNNQREGRKLISRFLHGIGLLVGIYLSLQPLLLGFHPKLRTSSSVNQYQYLHFDDKNIDSCSQQTFNTTDIKPRHSRAPFNESCINPIILQDFTQITTKTFSKFGSFPMHNSMWTSDVYFSVFNRPLFIVGVGYILYQILLPIQHPSYLSRTANFFLWSGFQIVGKYSYGLYLFHTRIILQLMMKSLPFIDYYGQLKQFFEANGTETNHINEEWILIALYFIYFVLTVFCSFGCAWFCTNMLENRIQELLFKTFKFN